MNSKYQYSSELNSNTEYHIHFYTNYLHFIKFLHNFLVIELKCKTKKPLILGNRDSHVEWIVPLCPRIEL